MSAILHSPDKNNKENLIDFAQNADQEKLDEMIQRFSDLYYNTENPEIDDATFDAVVDIYKQRFKTEIEIGAAPSKNMTKVNLPHFMSSLSKITKLEEVDKFNKKMIGKDANETKGFTITDKLDGCSAMYLCKSTVSDCKLYSRGNGKIGTDISHLLFYLKLPLAQENESYYVRGELVLSKQAYNDCDKNLSHSRNLVSGCINAKNPDQNVASKMDFLAYRLLDKSLSSEEQLRKLEILKYKVVWSEQVKLLKFDQLQKIVQERRLNSEYQIDGLVLSYNVALEYPNKNPDHMIAFKMVSEVVETKIIQVCWTASKYNVLIPVIFVEPKTVSGCLVSKFTGHNARYIYKNNLGPDSIVKIARKNEVIPGIVEIVKSTKPSMPANGLYKWIKSDSKEFTKNDVDIVDLTNSTESQNQQKIVKLYSFFSKLGVKHMGESTIEKLFKHKLDTVKKFITYNEDQFITEGVGKVLAAKLHQSIHEHIENCDLPTLMSASGIFHEGIGVNKLQLLVSSFPNILDEQFVLTKDKILNIKGLGKSAVSSISENLPIFKSWLKEHSEITLAESRLRFRPILDGNVNAEVDNNQSMNKNQFVYNKTLVFTGFRDKDLENRINSLGGKLTGSVSKNTDYLIVVPGNPISTKENKANDLGIPVMSKDELIKQLQK